MRRSCDLSRPKLVEHATRNRANARRREAGVRNLKKHLEKLYRKAALKLVQVIDPVAR